MSSSEQVEEKMLSSQKFKQFAVFLMTETQKVHSEFIDKHWPEIKELCLGAAKIGDRQCSCEWKNGELTCTTTVLSAFQKFLATQGFETFYITRKKWEVSW